MTEKTEEASVAITLLRGGEVFTSRYAVEIVKRAEIWSRIEKIEDADVTAIHHFLIGAKAGDKLTRYKSDRRLHFSVELHAYADLPEKLEKENRRLLEDKDKSVEICDICGTLARCYRPQSRHVCGECLDKCFDTIKALRKKKTRLQKDLPATCPRCGLSGLVRDSKNPKEWWCCDIMCGYGYIEGVGECSIPENGYG